MLTRSRIDRQIVEKVNIYTLLSLISPVASVPGNYAILMRRGQRYLGCRVTVPLTAKPRPISKYGVLLYPIYRKIPIFFRCQFSVQHRMHRMRFGKTRRSTRLFLFSRQTRVLSIASISYDSTYQNSSS